MKKNILWLGVLQSAFALATIASASTNLALTGTASQSSTLGSYGGLGVAWKAIDGNTDGSYYNGSVTHTDYEQPTWTPWWQVDLGGSFYIGSFTLWNRTDGNEYRLQNFEVSLWDYSSNKVWSKDFFTDKTYPDPSFSFTLPTSTKANVFRVALKGGGLNYTTPSDMVGVEDRFLSLAEVQVFEGKAPVATVPDTASSMALFGAVSAGFVFLRRKQAA